MAGKRGFDRPSTSNKLMTQRNHMRDLIRLIYRDVPEARALIESKGIKPLGSGTVEEKHEAQG